MQQKPFVNLNKIATAMWDPWTCQVLTNLVFFSRLNPSKAMSGKNRWNMPKQLSMTAKEDLQMLLSPRAVTFKTYWVEISEYQPRLSNLYQSHSLPIRCQQLQLPASARALKPDPSLSFEGIHVINQRVISYCKKWWHIGGSCSVPVLI